MLDVFTFSFYRESPSAVGIPYPSLGLRGESPFNFTY